MFCQEIKSWKMKYRKYRKIVPSLESKRDTKKDRHTHSDVRNQTDKRTLLDRQTDERIL
jgi:hypothetical protein